MSERPYSTAQDEDDFTVSYYQDGRFRLCLDTSDPTTIPRFRQALDCIEAILKLPKYPRIADEIDVDWAE